ncbi:hypothetical protein NUU61_005073 [Penicillium alfredii]|uniref:Allergen Asp f 4 n=1 Tax=Penicillium alfredii TaxID=1506179 RepID=A0A9W9K876_9EURO|nr:uncharacterized protein NUU61_005073 [Penicillium alfredii]KAJ5095717.1 hypothetical protein NUU61_005073 [Penicillium alfredii]
MHLPNSMFLVTALTAGSAVARMHGHERRHAHPNAPEVEVEGPSTTQAPEVDLEMAKRDVGDMVTVNMGGKLVSWINKWAGGVNQPETANAAQTQTQQPAPQPTSSDVLSSVIPTPASDNSGSDSDDSGDGTSWTVIPKDGQYSRLGFGGTSKKLKKGDNPWDWVGNLGIPWGSNIIQVSKSKAHQYKHVVKFVGSDSEPWIVNFWNSFTEDYQTASFTPHSALKFTLGKGEEKFVAFDDNTQGGWGAAPLKNQARDASSSATLPTNQFGQYAVTWGEVDMSSENNGYSGWDVSCITAQNASMPISGMKICETSGDNCSIIGKDMSKMVKAYNEANKHSDHDAVSVPAGPLRLIVNLDYME